MTVIKHGELTVFVGKTANNSLLCEIRQGVYERVGNRPGSKGVKIDSIRVKSLSELMEFLNKEYPLVDEYQSTLDEVLGC